MSENENTQIIKSVCPRDCPDTCGMLTHVKDGRVEKVVGDPNHPITRGYLCFKCRDYEKNWINHPERLQYPLIRDRKSDPLRRCSWEEALTRITDQYRSIVDQYGGSAILPYSYLGHMGLVSSRFPDRLWNKMNTARVGAEICAMAGAEAMIRVVGRVRGTEPQHMNKTRLYIAWGKNPKETNIHLWSVVRKIPHTVVVDPFASDTALDVGMHIAPRPGTDVTLVLGLMRVLIDNNWIDSDYIAKNTSGFEALAARVRSITLAEVEQVTGVTVSAIEALARLYHENRPGLIHIGVGLQRNTNGGEMVAAVCMLAAITGQIGTPGGGVLYANYEWLLHDTSYAHLRTDGPYMYNMIKLGQYLTATEQIKALYVYNQNPAVTCPNQNLVLQGLRRDDLFLVVHDLFLTDTAQLADVVLPATSFAESTDLQLSYWHDYVQINNQAIEPAGEARSNHWVVQQIAKYMGYTEPCFEQSEEQVIREALQGTGLDFDELKEGPVLWKDLERTSFDDLHFPTGSAKIELYAVQELSTESLTHNYRFITPKTHRLQGSQYANMPDKLGPLQSPWVFVHPDDAAREGVGDGDPVELWNERGTVRLLAKVSDRVRPGLLICYMVRWGSNANATTPDREADMGGNSTFHTNYVSVRRAGTVEARN